MAKKTTDTTDSETPLRIGTVPYCNAWPLVHYLPDELPGAMLSEWFPADMRLRLMAHHLDLALMPVAELMNLPYGKIAGDCCIACRGAVRSVLLMSRKPLEKIETISLDTASRSSITVCELMLRRFYNLRPTRYKLSPDKPLDDCKTDAFVVIGDRALAYTPSDRWEYRYDIGELWQRKTGLPFVFAAWIGCSDRVWERPGLFRGLRISRERGLENLDRVLEEKSRQGVRFPVERDAVKSYLSEAVVYRLGPEEQLGLQEFFDTALVCGLTKHRTVLEMVDVE